MNFRNHKALFIIVLYTFQSFSPVQSQESLIDVNSISNSFNTAIENVDSLSTSLLSILKNESVHDSIKIEIIHLVSKKPSKEILFFLLDNINREFDPEKILPQIEFSEGVFRYYYKPCYSGLRNSLYSGSIDGWYFYSILRKYLETQTVDENSIRWIVGLLKLKINRDVLMYLFNEEIQALESAPYIDNQNYYKNILILYKAL